MRTDKGSQTGLTVKAAVIGLAIAAAILVFGTWWVGQSASRANEEAVNAVSMFYLDELAGRREQVVAQNLETSINNLQAALSLMTEDDLSDVEQLQAFQTRMKKLYNLEKFAFVDTDGRIYTALGIQNNIGDYHFDPNALEGAEISLIGDGENRSVVIAVPLDNIPFNGGTLVACFMEMTMQSLIDGLSLQSDANETTFCNIYTKDGVSLTNMVLGGLASEDNLLDAMKNAQFDDGYSLDTMVSDFREGVAGHVSFTYNDIHETLDYVPVEGTDWMLTYLIRESVISEQISDISNGVVLRSALLAALIAIVLVVVGAIVLGQMRRSSQLALEKETLATESRVKQEEMEHQLALQEQLLEQEKSRAQQDKMITALSSDYRSVYYVDIDADEGICYQSDILGEGSLQAGDHFSFHEEFAQYAAECIDESFRDEFLAFIEPDAIRAALAEQPVISMRYLSHRGGKESYEMVRMAGVRHVQDRTDGIVHAVGMGIVDVDRETREDMAQSQALSDALSVAEDASRAKTIFLSNMSHEIRTPMNAIIGLDSIALADPDISDKTRDQLEKIGDSARHLLGIINDILDVSRIESGRMVLKSERFSFPKLIEQVNTIIGGQCSEKGLDYHCQINSQVSDYYIGDNTKLRQTLINILGNAVKFTPTGGNVRFTVERTAQFEGHTTLRFTIQDTGIGMSEEFLPHVFDSFAQEDSSARSRYGSTGLGLAITKNIVEMMNGSIEVQSRKDEGSTFTVTVTLLDAEDQSHDDHGDIDIDPSTMNVLVIDDDPIACEHAQLVLEAAGITAKTVQSGAEAVEVVRLRYARREPFNLILVDWKMPDMDGVETTRQIRKIVGNDTAIIILTAYNWDEVLNEAVEAGVDCFIAKPVFAANVIEEFREALRKRGLTFGATAKKIDLTGRRVLLAEDMPINAEIMKEILKMHGLEVDHAENGRIAMEMFAEHPEGYYDAVLMDVRMPEMDGLAATTAIRAMDRSDAKTIPIIALTANAFDEDVQLSLQAGLNAHLSKPVEPEVLFETLESLIKE